MKRPINLQSALANEELRLDYQPRGLGRALEPVVLRPRLAKAVRGSLAGISRYFA